MFPLRVGLYVGGTDQSSLPDIHGKRSMIAEMLLLNPTYKLLEQVFLPLWEVCSEGHEDPEYLERLLYIFSKV